MKNVEDIYELSPLQHGMLSDGVTAGLTGLHLQQLAHSFRGDFDVGQFEQAYRDEIQANPTYAQLPDDLRNQLRRNVLESLIQQRVIDNYLSEAGYQISDEQIMRLIQQTPDFQTDGVFDIDVVKRANDNLIATIEESLQIADEGKRKRIEAEARLLDCETELRRTLAAARSQTNPDEAD